MKEFVITGSTSIPWVENHAMILKLDSTGSLISCKKYPLPYGSAIHECILTSDLQYVFTGTTDVLGSDTNNLLLMKIDTAGTPHWARSFGGNWREFSGSVGETADGGYYLSGSSQSFGSNSIDGYLIRTDGNGIIEWSKTYGGTQKDEFIAGVPTADGGYMATGNFGYIGTLYPDIYVVKTDSSGNSGCLEFTVTSDTISFELVEDTCNINMLLVPTHVTAPTLAFPNGLYSTPICSSTETSENVNQIDFIVYPNPAEKYIHIRSSIPLIGTMRLYDLLGNLVYEQNCTSQFVTIPIGDELSGLYLIKFTDKNSYTIPVNSKIVIGMK